MNATYRLQPVHLTQQSQLRQWCTIITKYCQLKDEQTLSLSEFVLFSTGSMNTVVSLKDRPLFTFSRSLNLEARRAIAQDLIKKGYATALQEVSLDSVKSLGKLPSLRISWRTVNDWASLIYDYALKYELLDTIYTIYELHSGDLSLSIAAEIQGFNLLDSTLSLKVIEELVQQNKAEIYQVDDSTESTAQAETIDETAFKFLRI